MKFEIFSNFKNLRYGLSERADGPMKFMAGRGAVTRNRAEYFARHGIFLKDVVSAMVNHGNKVARVGNRGAGQEIANTDALVTSKKSIVLSLTVADCFPIYVYGSSPEAVGLIHAGWRGVLAGVVRKTLLAMRDNFKITPDKLLVAVGPGIRDCHFETHSDVAGKFKLFPEALKYRRNKIFIDLPKVIISQISACGIPKQNIEMSDECTYDLKKKYFSHRRDKLVPLEAMVAFLGLKKSASSQTIVKKIKLDYNISDLEITNKVLK